MTEISQPNLWLQAWADLHTPQVRWQVAAIVICMAIAWMMARLVRGMLTAHEAKLRMMHLGVQSFTPVLWPMLALGFIALDSLVMEQWLPVHLLQLTMPLLASLAFIRLIFYVLRRVFARGGHIGNLLLVSEKLIAILVWTGVALYITGLWPNLTQFLDQIMIPLGQHKVSVLDILQAVISVAITLMLALWASALLEERLMGTETMHSSVRAVMARTGRGALILVAVLLSLSLVGIDLTVLSVFGGALGVGIGLGLQRIVSSYFSGFVILLERSISIGDVVAVDKYYGQVVKINTRYTIVRGLDGIDSIIPNEMLVSGLVQNSSLHERSIRLSTQLTISYISELEKVLALLKEAVSNVRRVCKEPAPQVLVMKFSGDGIELEIGFWISDPENGRANVISEVNRTIWQVLQRNRIRVPRIENREEPYVANVMPAAVSKP